MSGINVLVVIIYISCVCIFRLECNPIIDYTFTHMIYYKNTVYVIIRLEI